MPFEVVPALTVDIPILPGLKRRRAFQETLDRGLELVDRHEALYLVDAPGLEANKADVELVQELAEEAPDEVWVDGGPRVSGDVMDLLIAGAGHVVVRWPLVRTAAELRAASEMSPRVHLGLVFQDNELVPNPREEGARVADLVVLARELNLGIVVIGEPGPGGHGTSPRKLTNQLRHFRGDRRFLGPAGTPGSRGELADLGYDGAFVEADLLEAGSHV